MFDAPKEMRIDGARVLVYVDRGVLEPVDDTSASMLGFDAKVLAEDLPHHRALRARAEREAFKQFGEPPYPAWGWEWSDKRGRLHFRLLAHAAHPEKW